MKQYIPHSSYAAIEIVQMPTLASDPQGSILNVVLNALTAYRGILARFYTHTFTGEQPLGLYLTILKFIFQTANTIIL